jgi:Uma2 family endonuclease
MTAVDVRLIIEVAIASASYDREVRLSLYAVAGVREVWLIDLAADTVETYRYPLARATWMLRVFRSKDN